MKQWNRSAFSWNYRRANHEGLSTNELEPTAYRGCFLLESVSSASQQDSAGVMHFTFALINTRLKDEGPGCDLRRKIGQFGVRLSQITVGVLEKTQEKFERASFGENQYLTFKVKFFPQDNRRNFTECTMDLFLALLQALGIEPKEAGGGTSFQQTYIWHEGRWADYLHVEEAKRGMIERVIGSMHGEDDF